MEHIITIEYQRVVAILELALFKYKHRNIAQSVGLCHCIQDAICNLNIDMYNAIRICKEIIERHDIEPIKSRHKADSSNTYWWWYPLTGKEAEIHRIPFMEDLISHYKSFPPDKCFTPTIISNL